MSKSLEKYVTKLSTKLNRVLPVYLAIPLIVGNKKVLPKREDTLFKLIEKEKVYTASTKIINIEVQKNETESKEKLIDKILKDKTNIFFLTSTHSDSALDHKDYQGKIYVDSKWQKKVKDKDLSLLIEMYITNNEVKTFQWVVDKPVWFVTRPNCRHYFKPLAVNEVLSTSVPKMIKKYDMTRKIGDYRLQTYAHSLAGKHAPTNVQAIIEQYQARYDFHMSLYNAKKSILIDNAIKKDLILIRKWKHLLLDKSK